MGRTAADRSQQNSCNKENFDQLMIDFIHRRYKILYKKLGVPVVIHTESTTRSQCKELALMGKKVGLPAEKIVKHFSPPLIDFDENFGLIPSVLASRKNIVASLEKGSRFMMETDYIDDPRRPGAVLGPKTVPKLTKNLLDSDLMSEKQSNDVHVNFPQKTYNIDLSN